MIKSKKALIRQTTIFSRLNTGETVNVKSLAEEFDVGVRTIQKDMNERLSSSYDIVDLGHGNYTFAEGYCLKGSDDEEEKIAISLMKSLQQNAIPDMNSYIESALPTTKSYEEMFLFDFDFEPIRDMGTFKIILKAIQWRVGLEFSYTKVNGHTKEVTVHPYRIANFQNYWYLIAYDLVDEKIKAYYLKEIEKLRTLYENFISDEAVELKLTKMCSQIDSAWYSDDIHCAKLSLKGEAKHYMERYLPHNMELIETNEASTLVNFNYNNETEILGFVKKWLPDIEICDNPELSLKLNETIQTYLNQNK